MPDWIMSNIFHSYRIPSELYLASCPYRQSYLAGCTDDKGMTGKKGGKRERERRIWNSCYKNLLGKPARCMGKQVHGKVSFSRSTQTSGHNGSSCRPSS